MTARDIIAMHDRGKTRLSTSAALAVRFLKKELR